MAVPPPLPAREAKPALRRRLRAARTAHVAAIGAGGAGAIARRLAPLLADAAAIGGYVAHRGEPDVLPAMIARRAALALPRTGPDGAMRFVGWTPGGPLERGHAGIAEPVAGATVVPDLLLVPLVGFDRARHRLGQGAGCYDRWLAAHAGIRTIGVAWSVQEVAMLPVDSWDVALDVIVTETETIAV